MRRLLLVTAVLGLGLGGACGSSSASDGGGGTSGGGEGGGAAGHGGGAGGGAAGQGGGAGNADSTAGGHGGDAAGAAGQASSGGSGGASGAGSGAAGHSGGAGGGGTAGAGGQTSGGGSGGAAGQIGGGGTGGVPTGILLTPSSTGFVSNTIAGVIGGWFAFGDGDGPDGTPTNSDCVSAGGFSPSQCSQITAPSPNQPFPPNANGAMCTSGTAAQVIPIPGSAAPAYVDLWGAGIGLYFNNPLGSASTKQPFDLSQFTGISFDFSGAIIPAGKIRVLFPFMGQLNGTDSVGDPPYWAANATDDHSTLLGGATPGHNVVRWRNVVGPYYLTQQTPPSNPPAFDPSMAYGIQFLVFTNSSASTPYAFCINNLTLLTD